MIGVAAYLKQEPDGKVRLLLADVESVGEGENPDWRHRAFFTSADYDAMALEEFSLSKDQFAEIGENLVLRLLTLAKAPE